MKTLQISGSGPLRGEIRPPSDKSLTHRAYMLGAIADGHSRIRMPLRGEDCEATRKCLEQMGLRCSWLGTDEVELAPARDWIQPQGPLDCGNSGTTMRLLSGLIASRRIVATLAGDASLSRRPMGRIADPLRLMGAHVEGELPPLTIQGADLHGIEYRTPVASAQIKSCILLAGLRAEGETAVIETEQSRDHTERMLRGCGIQLETGITPDGWRVALPGGQTPRAFEIEVPADISSAAFFMVAAAIVAGSEVRLREVGVNPSRSGILDVFKQAGVRWERLNERAQAGEPMADLLVWGDAALKPFRIVGPLVPRLIDEIPVLAVLASQCHGTTEIRDAAELRVKESDRIERVAAGLRAMGAEVETYEDGLAISGPTPLKGAAIDAEGDHRIAMAFAVAGLAAWGDTVIHGAESIATSYPGFESDLGRLQAV